jgi:methylthioribose-1-phosphate isomerase
MTICNTGFLATGGSGTAFSAIFHASRKKPHVFVLETRPLLQGARLTMWELEKASISATLICDSAAATIMKTHKIDSIFVGADRIARNGDTANKIGTLQLAILASHFAIPFYVCAPSSTFDNDVNTGKQIPIEQRPAQEISRRFQAFNPAFDVTPAKLIAGFITERGIFKKPADFIPRAHL